MPDDACANTFQLGKIPYEDVRAVVRAIAPVYQRGLSAGIILRQDLLAVIQAAPGITDHDRAQVLAAFADTA